MKPVFIGAIFLISVALSTQNKIHDLLNDEKEKQDINPECLKQLEVISEDLQTLWKMFDASSKYPITGMSYSNNKDLGNFDECINIQTKGKDNTQVKGKFCAFNVVVASPFPPIPDPFVLNLNNTGPTVKDFSNPTVTFLSVCVPDKCTPEEVGSKFLWGDIPIVRFPPGVPSCMTIDSNSDFQWGDIIVTFFLSCILLLLIVSTGYDFYIQKTNQKSRHPLYLAFSIMTNGKKLIHTTTTKNPEQIQCLNGIRFISMMWVIAGHGFVGFEQTPLINYKEIRAYIDNMAVTYISPAPIAVDTFFFLSGFLLAFGYLKSLGKTTIRRQLLQVPMMYVHRYLRLTPALAVVFLVTVTIFRMTGSGPLWDTVVNQTSDQCTKHWWAFFLYVQNYVNYNDMCLTHTWYLSADMQMFLLAPLVLIPLALLINTDRRNLGIWSLLGLIVIWVIVPIGIRFADQTIDNVYDTHSRFNDYLIGVLLGMVLRDPRFKKFPFHKLTNLAIWCFVLIADVAFIFYYHSIIRIYEHTSDTLFYGLYRPIWCFSLFWIIYSCYHGYGGPVNWFLSLPAFQIGGRLSYCMYLLHAIVVMYFIGLVRTSFYWGDYMEFYLWCGHFIITMVLSAIWSLAFESPMIVIEKFLFGR